VWACLAPLPLSLSRFFSFPLSSFILSLLRFPLPFLYISSKYFLYFPLFSVSFATTLRYPHYFEFATSDSPRHSALSTTLGLSPFLSRYFGFSLSLCILHHFVLPSSFYNYHFACPHHLGHLEFALLLWIFPIILHSLIILYFICHYRNRSSRRQLDWSIREDRVPSNGYFAREARGWMRYMRKVDLTKSVLIA
jgi:hypothetical protein